MSTFAANKGLRYTRLLLHRALLPGGESTLEVEFHCQEGDGEMSWVAANSLEINSEIVAQGSTKSTGPAQFGVDTFGVSEKSDQPVTND